MVARSDPQPADRNELLRDFDHHGEEFGRTFRRVYSQARSSCPVIHSERYGGFSVLTRYGDVRQALRDHGTFASGRFQPDGRSELLGGGQSSCERWWSHG
jgi:cytochrome P450